MCIYNTIQFKTQNLNIIYQVKRSNFIRTVLLSIKIERLWIESNIASTDAN